jgi:imidazolonepropionase-like amidohydrolase
MKIIYIFTLFLSINTYALTYIHSSKFFDVESGKYQSDKTIIIENKKIIDIKDGYVNPSSNENLIDLRGKFLFPGFMDMHVHFGQEYQSKAERPAKIERETQAILAADHAIKTLKVGFTTVRQVGDSGLVAISLRDLINSNKVIGPTIYTSGKSIATTGGHADPTNGKSIDDYDHPKPEDGVINGPYDAFKAVRQRYKDGADGIKLTVTGGVLSVAKSGDNPQFTIDEINAVVDAAKDYGFWVAVHAHGPEGMKRAVIAGVDSVEHGTFMTEEIMDLMIKNNVYYVPTISAGEFVAQKSLIDNYFPDIVRPKAASVGPQIGNTFKKAHLRGVPIAFGTDAGVQAHGTNLDEFLYMVNYGMTPANSIISATKNTAMLLNIYDTVGSIDIGKDADLVAIDADPLKLIENIKKISFVMKEGNLVDLK